MHAVVRFSRNRCISCIRRIWWIPQHLAGIHIPSCLYQRWLFPTWVHNLLFRTRVASDIHYRTFIIIANWLLAKHRTIRRSLFRHLIWALFYFFYRFYLLWVLFGSLVTVLFFLVGFRFTLYLIIDINWFSLWE